jgi:hypothetical protein
VRIISNVLDLDTIRLRAESIYSKNSLRRFDDFLRRRGLELSVNAPDDFNRILKVGNAYQ